MGIHPIQMNCPRAEQANLQCLSCSLFWLDAGSDSRIFTTSDCNVGFRQAAMLADSNLKRQPFVRQSPSKTSDCPPEPFLNSLK